MFIIMIKMTKQQMLANNSSGNNQIHPNQPKQQCWRRIAVVGGGAASLSFCLQLFNKLAANAPQLLHKLEIVVLEKSANIGPGLAYGKELEGNLSDAQILNIPKDGMSLVVNEFGHFSGWLEKNREKYKDGLTQADYTDKQFPPRHIFGEYLMAQAEQLAKRSQKHGQIKIRFWTNTRVDEIMPIDRGEEEGEMFEIEYSKLDGHELFQHSSKMVANQVVLCVGHMPAHTYRHFIGIPGYAHCQSTIAQQFGQIGGMDPVLILGTRLSAIDLVLALQNAQHRGPIWICSRNGLLPAAYKPLNVAAFEQQKEEAEEHSSSFKLVTKSWLQSNELKAMRSHAIKYVHGSSIQNDMIFCCDSSAASPLLPMMSNDENCCCKNAGCNLIGIQLGHEKLPLAKEARENLKKEVIGQNNNKNNGLRLKSLEMAHFDEFKGDQKFTVKEMLDRFFKQLTDFGGPKTTLEKVIARNKQMSPVEWFEEQFHSSDPSMPTKPWQLLMAALQPMMPALWSALDMEEKAAFWERVHGLYMCYYPSCPRVNARRMRDMFLGGQLRLIRHLDAVKYDPAEKMFVVEGETFADAETAENGQQTRGGERIQVKAKHLFNATGAGMIAANMPVIDKLLRNGHAKAHPFGGIFVDERTLQVLVDDSENAKNNLTTHQNLFAIGDLTSGQFYKTACLGMVAEQAEIVADQIAHIYSKFNDK